MPYKDPEKSRQNKREYHRKNKEILSIKKRAYYLKNRETIIEKRRKYRIANRKKVNEYQKLFARKNKVKIAEYKKGYFQAHYIDRIIPYKNKNRESMKKNMRKYRAKRIKSDIGYRLAINLRNRLRMAIKKNFKVGSAVKDLGCTIEEFKIYMEKRFSDGMNWSNWGKDGWHIDHIKPLKDFDLTRREDLLKACHYTNLQPLWWHENLSKRFI